MSRVSREHFDALVDRVVAELPSEFQQMLDATTMYVEDYPSETVMTRMNVRDRRGLCGLYQGVPLTQRSVHHSGHISEAIYLYRWGIALAAGEGSGRLSDDSLCEQIRITIMHELGHHHGLDEDDLEQRGY